MDERKLTELFSAAVKDAPPASFDEHDVATRSRQVTARRRALVAGGSGLVVALFAVGLFLATGGFGHTFGSGTYDAESRAAAGPAMGGSSTFGNNVAGGARGHNDIPQEGTSFPMSPPLQGGGSTGKVGPDADGTPTGCGPAGGQLAVALASELPPAGAHTSVPLGCPSGVASGAEYEVSDGANQGRIIVFVVPAGHVYTGMTTVAGVRHASARDAAGQQILVLSQRATGSTDAPYVDQLPTIAAQLAQRF